MEQASIHRGQGEARERGGLSGDRLAGGGSHKQGSFLTELVLGNKMSRGLHPPARISQVCREALTGFSPEGLNRTFHSQGCTPEQLLVWEQWAERTCQDRGGVRSL